MIQLYTALIIGTIWFQVALIFGAPFGRITQGGQTSGSLPFTGRAIAGASIFILVGMALAMRSAEGTWPHWPDWTSWVAAAANGIVMVLNWITPSAAERRLWGPITTAIFGLALAIVFTN